jgi:hypothetical protein
MRIILLYLLGVVASALFALSDGLACGCDLPRQNGLQRQIAGARNDATAVFSGKVVDVTESSNDHFNVLVRLKVKRWRKGVGADEVLIATGRGGGDCGYRFEVGESYLVYAFGSGEGGLGTNICQRTRKLEDAGEDIEVLGKGRAPRVVKRLFLSM